MLLEVLSDFRNVAAYRFGGLRVWVPNSFTEMRLVEEEWKGQIINNSLENSDERTDDTISGRS